jgi:hypothetical protein
MRYKEGRGTAAFTVHPERGLLAGRGITGREWHYRKRGASREDRALQVEMVIAGKDCRACIPMHYAQDWALQAERGITGRVVHFRQGGALQALQAERRTTRLRGALQAERVTSRLRGALKAERGITVQAERGITLKAERGIILQAREGPGQRRELEPRQ